MAVPKGRSTALAQVRWRSGKLTQKNQISFYWCKSQQKLYLAKNRRRTMDGLEIGNRMKEFYENVLRTRLMRRCPVALRMDGKAFKHFTENFKKPYDRLFRDTMQETMLNLCQSIQGCVLGYTQSDEITLSLVDYETFSQEAWFNYEIQKMVSTAASMTTMYFNKIFERKTREFVMENCCLMDSNDDFSQEENPNEELHRYVKIYKDAVSKGAMFDARCFNVPKEEVTNLIYWRQLVAIRNYVQMAARTHLSNTEVKNKITKEMKQMLEQIGITWEDYSVDCQRGACAIREQRDGDVRPHWYGDVRPHWYVDKNIPIFKGKDRDYVNRFVFIE